MLEDFLAALVPNGSNSLNTKKIDRNIEMLKRHSWFRKITMMKDIIGYSS